MEDGIIGKFIFIIFEDGTNHFSKKTGICTNNSDSEIILDNKTIIPKQRVVRMEILGDNIKNGK